MAEQLEQETEALELHLEEAGCVDIVGTTNVSRTLRAEGTDMVADLQIGELRAGDSSSVRRKVF